MTRWRSWRSSTRAPVATATRRKAALKQLETHLASTDLAKLLDRTTLQAMRGLGGDVKLTWAGLCTLADAVRLRGDPRVRGARNPREQARRGHTRRLVATAEDPKRRARVGVVAPLLRRAGKLFAHVLEILRRGPPDFATEYTHDAARAPGGAAALREGQGVNLRALADLYKERLAAALAAARGDDADDAGASREGERGEPPPQIARAAAAMSARHVPERRAARGGDVPGKRARGAGGREPAGRTPARHSGAGAQRRA